MRREKIIWEAICRTHRHAAIRDIQALISNHAYIVHSNLFSDMALSLAIEVEETEIEALFDSLSRVVEIKRKVGPQRGTEEYFLLMNIRFAQGSGDVRHQVPDVPG